jgi:hypothetical protein
MVLQEVGVLKYPQSKGIISAHSTLPRSATFTHSEHKQENFGINLAIKSHRNMDVVRSLFLKVISRFGDTQWPARSPDIAVTEFCL